jgi:FKBP-type peptidyl-prolyl cis-trans isomerase FklB
MKYRMIAAVGLGLVAASALADDKGAAQGDPELKDLKQKASYSLGIDIGRKLKAQAIDLDGDLVSRGIKDALGGKSAMSDADMRTAMMTFQQELLAKQNAVAQVQAEKNKKEGEDFLAANKKKPGVVTLPSGLQYQVVKEGTGKTPKATDTVTTNYEGKLIDGTVFDSSYKRGEPASFPVNGVIKGWTEALQLMKAGSKWKLFIPSELAYGANPRPGGPIGPNAVLIFDIELLDVK